MQFTKGSQAISGWKGEGDLAGTHGRHPIARLLVRNGKDGFRHRHQWDLAVWEMTHIPGAARLNNGSILGYMSWGQMEYEARSRSHRRIVADSEHMEKEISFVDKRWGSARELTRNGTGPFDWLHIQWV